MKSAREYAIAFSVIFLLGASLSGMTVALVASPALINVAIGLCIFGGTGVLGTALLRFFCKKSS